MRKDKLKEKISELKAEVDETRLEIVDSTIRLEGKILPKYYISFIDLRNISRKLSNIHKQFEEDEKNE